MTAQTIAISRAISRAVTDKIQSFQHSFEKEEIIKWLDENNLDHSLYIDMHAVIYAVCEDWDDSKRWNFFNPCTQERSDTLNKFLNTVHQVTVLLDLES